MPKVYVVTFPHSGTHFAEKLLDLLKVPHERIHAMPENVRRLWSIRDAKIITTWRDPDLSARSLYNRSKELQNLPPEAAAMEMLLSYNVWHNFLHTTLMPSFGFYIDKEKVRYKNPGQLAHLIADFLGVECTSEAVAYVCMWPIESSFPSQRIKTADGDYLTFALDKIPIGSLKAFQWVDTLKRTKQIDWIDDIVSLVK